VFLLLERGPVTTNQLRVVLPFSTVTHSAPGTGRTGTVFVSYMSIAVWSLPKAAMIVALVRICMNGAIKAR